MPDRTCKKCGAELVLPEDPTAVAFHCQYCSTAYRVADFVTPETRERKDRSRATRSLSIIFGIGTVGFVAAIVFVMRGTPENLSDDVHPSFGAAVPNLPSRYPERPQASQPAASPEAPAASGTVPQKSGAATRVLQFGEKGTGPGQFDRARQIAVGARGDVFVADRSGRVQKFDPAGKLLSSFRPETKNQPRGPLSDDIGNILGLAIDRAGKVYVSIGYDVLRFDGSDGKLETTFRGTPDKICYRDLSVDQSDNLYARSACSDANRFTIVKLGPTGNVPSRFAEPNTYEKAATGKIAVDGAGKLYVPHGYEYEVQILSPDGTLYTRFGHHGDAPGEFSTTALGPVLVDGHGRLFVNSGGTVDIFDTSGRYLARFPSDADRAGAAALGPDDSVFVIVGDDLVAKYAVATTFD